MSEAGAPGAPLAGMYRVAVLAIAGGLLLLAIAVRLVVPRRAVRLPPRLRAAVARHVPTRAALAPPGRSRARGVPAVLPISVAAVAAGALAVSAPLTAVSAVVPCSPGCPLPPYARPTAGDIVHASATIGGFASAALAMVILALAAPHPPVRRVSRLAAPVVTPLLVATAAAMVFVGRGVLTGAVERLALGTSVGWVIAVAVACAGPAGRGPATRRSGGCGTVRTGDETGPRARDTGGGKPSRAVTASSATEP